MCAPRGGGSVAALRSKWARRIVRRGEPARLASARTGGILSAKDIHAAGARVRAVRAAGNSPGAVRLAHAARLRRVHRVGLRLGIMPVADAPARYLSMLSEVYPA